MPTVTYSQEEYFALREDYDRLTTQLKGYQNMEPVRSIDEHCTSAALAEIWRALGVNNQTDCMSIIRAMTLPF